MTLDEIKMVYGKPVKFTADLFGLKFVCQDPIRTLVKDFDYQLMLIPIENGNICQEKAIIRYFTDDFDFNIE